MWEATDVNEPSLDSALADVVPESSDLPRPLIDGLGRPCVVRIALSQMMSGLAGVGSEAIRERFDEVAQFIGALDDERSVECGEYRRQPVKPLRP